MTNPNPQFRRCDKCRARQRYLHRIREQSVIRTSNETACIPGSTPPSNSSPDYNAFRNSFGRITPLLRELEHPLLANASTTSPTTQPNLIPRVEYSKITTPPRVQKQRISKDTIASASLTAIQPLLPKTGHSCASRLSSANQPINPTAMKRKFSEDMRTPISQSVIRPLLPIAESSTSSVPSSENRPEASTSLQTANQSLPPRIQKRKNTEEVPASSSLSVNQRLRPIAEKQKDSENTRTLEAVELALGFLKDEFEQHKIASQEFPPKISPFHIRSSISLYEDEMSAASQKSICCSCGKFFTGYVYQFENHDNFIQTHLTSLDRCGRDGNSWNFCSLCHSAIKRNTVPKFSAENFVNVTMCQHYPAALDNLTPIEECLIAKCHPNGKVLKLRPNGHVSSVSYNALRGHIIVIPQNPGPLLQILPSPELRLDNLIKVFWLGKQPPTDENLKPFLCVRKDKVLLALHYLVQHNQLYHDITINYPMIEDWPAEFIPPEVANNIIHIEKNDHHEREGYTVSLQTGNYENDFDAAQDEAFLASDDDPLVTGSVYTDVNGERSDPNLRLIDALLDVVTGNTRWNNWMNETDQDDLDEHNHENRQRNLPTISYATHGQGKLMSNWNAPHYFTGAFPTLFPNGIGGHLDERPIPVSLDAFAQWALNHHSRRLEFVSTFISSY